MRGCQDQVVTAHWSETRARERRGGGVVHCDDSESGDFGRSEYDSVFKGVGNRHEVTQKHKVSNALSVNLSDHGREGATALKQPSWPLTFHKEPGPFDQRGCGG